MGLRRTTTSVPLDLCAISSCSGALSPSGQETPVPATSTDTTAPAEVVLSSSDETVHGGRRRPSTKTKAGSSRIAAETAAAATKPLRERGLSARTRLAKKGVLAAATAAGAVDTKAADPRDPQDGMAPALTEPTAVPTTTATNKTDSSSPQPEIFSVSEGSGFADHHHPMAGDAENAATDNMGLGGGEQQQQQQPQQVKTSKRPKKEEFPLKELRSSRRRSNLLQNPAHQTPAAAVTNGKGTSRQPRWSTGGNGGTAVSSNVSLVEEVVVAKGRLTGETETEADAAEAGDQAKSEETPTMAPTIEATERLDAGSMAANNGPVERCVNTSAGAGVEEGTAEPNSVATTTEQMANNNNYLDKNRVPIIDSLAVKDEHTNTNGPESNSGHQPVITMNTVEESGGVASEVVEATVVAEQGTNNTLEGCDEKEASQSTSSVQESTKREDEEKAVEWSKPNGEQATGSAAGADDGQAADGTADAPQIHLMLPPEITVLDHQQQTMASDAALLEELVLMTPTKKLTEQLCMVLKDQERALEQQEQQQQQQQAQEEQQQQQQEEQLPVSNPSSQSTMKENAEMEQMLGDLAVTSDSYLLQVFKSFESAPTVDDGVAAGTDANLLSLLVADDDVDMMMTAGVVGSPDKCLARPPLVTHAAAAEREAQEQELDIAERQKMLTEMEQELSQMQRRRDFLLRRLRKQQVHHLGRQLSEEVVGLFELSARAASVMTPKLPLMDTRTFNKIKYLKSGARAADSVSIVTGSVAAVEGSSSSAQGGVTLVGEGGGGGGGEDVEDMTPASIVMRTDSPPSIRDLKGRNQTAVGHHPFIKPASPKAIRTFVQRVVATATSGGVVVSSEQQQQQQPASGLKSGLVNNSGKIMGLNNHYQPLHNNKLRPGLLFTSTSTLDDGHRLQLTNNVGLLKTELRIVERAIDSEATASSSGGESADELINYSNSVQESLAIANRAAWRWAQERARLASRWNWLTAEISDLEYRIRQHTDLHNQLRKSKGPVMLLRPVSDKEAGVVASEASVPVTDSTASPTAVNGYRGLLPGQYSSAKAFDGVGAGAGGGGADGFMADVENEAEGTSSRTRPYQRMAFKKRKLVQTMNLHTISKKAARPSSIKCGCQWPQQPCALCTGRSDPTIPRPLPDMIPRSQRAALLDPCLHPCLSFPEDVSQSIRCEAVLADPQWQHKVMKASKIALKSSIVAAAAAAGGTYKGLKMVNKDEVAAAKKAGKKYTQGLISRYKKSKNKNRGTHTKYVQLLKQHNSRKAAIKAGLHVPLSHGGLGGGGGAAGLDMGEYESGVARSRNASPTHHYYRPDRIERRSRNSYDIDNIVIPYSVAASTRVEILPYKEIPTPKWKLVDETDLDEDIQVETNQYQHQQQQAASSDSNSSTITALEFDSEEFLDEYIQEKHNRALLEERKKFSTFLKFPYSTRSRANRRIDSRAESSGANTPDPASPAPHTPSLGGDQESIPSPLCPSTPAPESVLDSETSSQGLSVPGPSNRIANNERRRTISLKMLSHQNSTASDAGASQRPRSQTPEPSGPQFERLDYPLTDRKYEDMLRQMPLNHERLDDVCLQQQQQAEEGGAVKTTTTTTTAATTAVVGGESGSAAKKARCVTWDPVVDLSHSAVVLLDDCGTDLGHIRASLRDDSDTESGESVPPEDPNDPEWVSQS